MNLKFLTKCLKSFAYALAGIKVALYTQVNMAVHFTAALLALTMAFYFNVSKTELGLIVLCIAMVIATELINTAIELLCDFIHPDRHEKIKQIKDISAGAVLITATAALVIGLVIFVPKLFLS